MTATALQEIDVALPRRKWPKYLAYRPVQLSWLRQPEHWEERRFKFLLTSPLQYGANEAGDDTTPGQPRFIRITDIDQNGNLRDDTFRSLPEDVAKPYLLQQGDVLLARSGATVGKSFLYRPSWGRAAFAGYLIRARVNATKAIPDYIHYFTQSNPYWDWIGSAFIQATIQNVSAEKYGNLITPLPPLDEQRAIAAFLDRETARIDELIAKKQRLITQLTIKREAKIAAAFTAQTDDSAHLPIKRLLTFTTSGSRGWAEFYSNEGDLFIQSGNLNRRLGLDLSVVQRIVPPEGAEAQRTMIRRGDILICITGAYTGNIAVVDFDPPRAFINQHIALLRVRHQIVVPKFVAYFLASSLGQGHFKASQYGGTKQGLGFEDIHSISIPLPPLDEQLRIVRRLDSDLRAIEEMAAVTNAGIAKLREYRSSLISAAVTGRIDVRHYGKEAT